MTLPPLNQVLSQVLRFREAKNISWGKVFKLFILNTFFWAQKKIGIAAIECPAVATGLLSTPEKQG